MAQGIPFLDLATPHRELESELLAVVQEALRAGSFIGGRAVQQFESAFAEFSETQYCVGVNSGTDALRFALIAAGVRAGEVVVTVPNTFIATTEAISQAGAVPEFVDVDERTCNLDPIALHGYLEAGCTSDSMGHLFSRRSKRRVAGIVPVHLFGQMADMDPILEIAERYRLFVIEDACQAHGAEYFSKREARWHRAGSMGSAAGFSFYPGKNLGACGDAGALVTNNEALAKTVRMLRDHGQAQKYYHAVEGYNGRLDAIQAGILQVKLRHLQKWNERRREAALRYDQLFEPAADVVRVLGQAPGREHVYHLYEIWTNHRDELREHLAAAHIDTGIHYPIPLHLQEAYRNLGYKFGDFPTTEKLAAGLLSLPMYPQLTAEEQHRVVEAVLDFAYGRAETARSVGAAD